MWQLRETATSPVDVAVASPGDAETEPDSVLVCASCGVPITSRAERLEVEGAHAHVRINPHGLTFHIGCFKSAQNLATVGPVEHYWSWFAGHGWQVECCARCGTHLGWLFSGDAGRFHGLILDRLAESPSTRAH